MTAKLGLIIAILILLGVVFYGGYLLYEAIAKRMAARRYEELRNLKSVDM